MSCIWGERAEKRVLLVRTWGRRVAMSKRREWGRREWRREWGRNSVEGCLPTRPLVLTVAESLSPGRLLTFTHVNAIDLFCFILE